MHYGLVQLEGRSVRQITPIQYATKISCSRKNIMHIGYWRESQKGRDHWEDQDVGGWTI
jgi:hypothetical protein